MKVRELKLALQNLGPGHDDKEVKAWLPGSTISLGPSMFQRSGVWCVEGNVDEGSALERLMELEERL